jgi:hypothetical protein
MKQTTINFEPWDGSLCLLCALLDSSRCKIYVNDKCQGYSFYDIQELTVEGQWLLLLLLLINSLQMFTVLQLFNNLPLPLGIDFAGGNFII